jgi:radical SAM protein with 4Fe4S-binding SPASM domain
VRFDNTIRKIAVEMSSICNFHCDICPAHSYKSRYKSKKLFADENLIDKIVPFLRKFNYAIRNVTAGATWGEPLLNSKFFSNNEKLINACPTANVIFTTNGSHLTASNIEKIFDATYIRRVAVSIDAGNKETYERVRKGGNWDELVHNLSSLIEKRDQRRIIRPIIMTNFVVTRSNYRELPQYVRQMGRLGVDVINAVNAHGCYSSDSCEGVFDLPGKVNDLYVEREKIVSEAASVKLPNGMLLNLPSFTPKKKSVECSFNGASGMNIGIEGEVYPCCVIQSIDYEGKEESKSMGNVFDEELESIWNSKQFLDFRLKMLRGQAPCSICTNCPFFYCM